MGDSTDDKRNEVASFMKLVELVGDINRVAMSQKLSNFEFIAAEIRDSRPELKKVSDEQILGKILNNDFGTDALSGLSALLGIALNKKDLDGLRTAKSILGQAMNGGFGKNAQSNAALIIIRAMNGEFGTNAEIRTGRFITDVISQEYGAEARERTYSLLHHVLRRDLKARDKLAGEGVQAQVNAATLAILFLRHRKVSDMLVQILKNPEVTNIEVIENIGCVWSAVLQNKGPEANALVRWLERNEKALSTNWRLPNIVASLILSYARVPGSNLPPLEEKAIAVLEKAMSSKHTSVTKTAAYLLKRINQPKR